MNESYLTDALQCLDDKAEKIDLKIKLPVQDSWPGTFHLFDLAGIWAVKAVLTAERPLLIRGEPGTGKSQFARAVATLLGRAFLYQVVNARSNCQDLQYVFDAVSRLGEAQILGAGAMKNEDGLIHKNLRHLRFIIPGILWWAFDWDFAVEQHDRCYIKGKIPTVPDGWNPEKGSVVLIDEIDKADIDLPNGLLETMGNGSFTVPFLDRVVGLSKKTPPPLVIITTNEERELPSAFVRRCFVLFLTLPDKEEECIEWLIKRGIVHFKGKCSKKVMERAAVQLWKDRTEAQSSGLAVPGQAEYLDILRVLSRLSKDEEAQLEALDAIRNYALRKNPV